MASYMLTSHLYNYIIFAYLSDDTARHSAYAPGIRPFAVCYVLGRRLCDLRAYTAGFLDKL